MLRWLQGLWAAFMTGYRRGKLRRALRDYERGLSRP